MATYRAPVDDMIFLFEKLRNNSHYNSLEKYKEVNSDLAKDKSIMNRNKLLSVSQK